MTTDVLAGFTKVIPTTRAGRRQDKASLSVYGHGVLRANKPLRALTASAPRVSAFFNEQGTRFALCFGESGTWEIGREKDERAHFCTRHLARMILGETRTYGVFPLIEQHDNVFIFSMDPVTEKRVNA